MGILARELMVSVVRPALERFGGFDPAVAQQLMGTAAQESQLGNWLRQQQGPALGIWQMEPFTHDDIHKTWLKYRPNVRKNLYAACHMQDYGDGIPPASLLVSNLFYSCLMARLKYQRARTKMPEFNDIVGQANNWKINYNSIVGKGDIAAYMLNYDRFLKKYYESIIGTTK